MFWSWKPIINEGKFVLGPLRLTVWINSAAVDYQVCFNWGWRTLIFCRYGKWLNPKVTECGYEKWLPGKHFDLIIWKWDLFNSTKKLLEEA